MDVFKTLFSLKVFHFILVKLFLKFFVPSWFFFYFELNTLRIYFLYFLKLFEGAANCYILREISLQVLYKNIVGWAKTTGCGR